MAFFYLCPPRNNAAVGAPTTAPAYRPIKQPVVHSSRRKPSVYAQPQFVGHMELGTLMVEGAAPCQSLREFPVVLTADGIARPQLENDYGTRSQNDRHRNDDDDGDGHPKNRKKKSAAGMKSSGDRPRSSLNLYVAALIVNLSALAAGCALTWSSPTLAKLKSGDPDTGLKITDAEASWVASLVTLGAAVGPLLAGGLLDRFGRKNTVLFSMILSIVSWIAIAAFPVLYSLYLARVLSGIAVGIVFTAVPMYIAEIAELRLRSSLGTLMQFFLVTGFLLEYIVGPYTSYSTLAIVSLSMPVLCFGIFMWIPDSPHSLLVRSGDEQKAMESLRWLRGNPQETDLIKELDEIKKSVDESKERKSGFGELFGDRGNIKALYISCAMVAWQQLSGINVVLMYSEPIFQKTGVPLSPSVCTIVVGSVMLFASGITPFLAKMTTMRTLLYVSAIGMAITDGTLGLFYYLQYKGQDVSNLGWLPLASLVVFIITYCLGFGPLPWAIMGEIFPTNLKSVASALTASFCWLLGFMLTNTFDSLSKAIGIYAVFWLFGVFCIVALLFTVFILPETEGKTLQEIQDILQGKSSKSSSPTTTGII